jgi:hypothetical protein
MGEPENFDAWELRALDRFATKSHVKELEGKVETAVHTTTEQGKVLARLEPALESMQRILGKILWAIVTPVLGGFGIGITWVIIQLVNNGGL